MSDAMQGNQETAASVSPSPALVVGVALILCAMWMLVWRGSLDGVFHFDDYGNIVDNQRVRQLWPLDDFLRNNRPIGLYSFAINYHFSGEKPFAYHVVNLAIHLVNGLLLYTGCFLCGRLWFRSRAALMDIAGQTSSGESGEAVSPVSPEKNGIVAQSEATNRQLTPKQSLRVVLIAGLVSTAWVIHPLTTQAVTNIAQRYESLSSLGYLGAWVGLLVYLSGRRAIGCAMIVGSAWIGLMSKEVFATAPLAILLFDRLLTQQPWKAIFRSRWLPYLLMVSPYLWFIPSVARFFDPARTRGGSMGLGMEKVSAWQYLRTQPEVIWHYLWLVVWPKDLCFDYMWRIQNDATIYLSLGATILTVLLLFVGCYLRGISPKAASSGNAMQLGLAGWLGLTFFFILAPTSSFMPIADLAFEHRMYLASAVVIAGIVLALHQISALLLHNSERPAVLRVAFTLILAAGISLLAWRTHLRNLDYRNGLTLWTGVTRLAPENPRAWYNLGRELYSRGDKQAALRPMISAVGLSSSSVPLFDVGLADTLRDMGRYQDAITLYQRAISKTHHFPEAHNNLGVVYLRLNQVEDARRAFETSVEQNHPEAKYNLAFVYLKKNQPRRAIPLLREMIDKHPEYPVAVRQLAWILATADDDQLRDVARAEQLMQARFDQLTTQNAYVLDTYGVIHAARGDFATAIDTTHKALSLAQANQEPNAELIADLQRRIQQYQHNQPWIGGSQP